jgi:signal transduction histidine kinase
MISLPDRSRAPAGRFEVWRESFWRRVIAQSDRRLRRLLIAITFAMVAVIGLADFLTGIQLSMLVFYFLPVCLAVAAVGRRFGVLIAFVSVATWLVGDYAAGAHYANLLIAGWNALIALGTYLVVVWLFALVLGLHRKMEERVRQRTIALTEEIMERERLEKAVLEIGERERHSIGRDLHDGLSQHLTGTALVAQAVEARLAARDAPEAEELRRIVGLIEQGIEETRSLAQGLLLAEIDRDGLGPALEDLATATRTQFRVDCEFQGDRDIRLGESGTVTHCYHIAQEAVRNAVRHGKARRISIRLSGRDETLTLAVRDNGAGLPPPSARGRGLGLRIMAHRAAIIGARFSVAAQPDGGTLALCELPLARSSS